MWYSSLTISKIGQKRKNWKSLQFAFCTFFSQIQNISCTTYYTFLESIWPDNFKNDEIFSTKEIFFAKCCKYCAKVCTSYLLSIFLSYDILKCRSMKIGVCKTCAKNIIAKLRKMLQNWLKLIWLIFSSHQLYKNFSFVAWNEKTLGLIHILCKMCAKCLQILQIIVLLAFSFLKTYWSLRLEKF